MENLNRFRREVRHIISSTNIKDYDALFDAETEVRKSFEKYTEGDFKDRWKELDYIVIVFDHAKRFLKKQREATHSLINLGLGESSLVNETKWFLVGVDYDGNCEMYVESRVFDFDDDEELNDLLADWALEYEQKAGIRAITMPETLFKKLLTVPCNLTPDEQVRF